MGSGESQQARKPGTYLASGAVAVSPTNWMTQSSKACSGHCNLARLQMAFLNATEAMCAIGGNMRGVSPGKTNSFSCCGPL